MPETNARIKVCHDTAANFKTNNPTLLVGEWALETDTKKMKIGDGSTAYNALPYSTAEDSEEWIKPDDWIDIRSGAIDNSIYFLVGHSVDYSTYNLFPINCRVSNSGTFDVFIDGFKIATASTGYHINWQELALDTGIDITYPETLRAHIVRITPTLNTNKFTEVRAIYTGAGYTDVGLLWAHFEIDYEISLYMFASTFSTQRAGKLEAITAKGDLLKTSSCYHSFYRCYSLKKTPVFDCTNASSATGFFADCGSIKNIKLKNFTATSAGSLFLGCVSLEKIESEGSKFSPSNAFNSCFNLQQIPPLLIDNTEALGFAMGDGLKDTYLDLSQYTKTTRLNASGVVNHKILGLKSVTVSNEAPFNSSTSPQIDVRHTGLSRAALVNLFKSMPYNVGYTVVGSPTIVDGVLSKVNNDVQVKTNLQIPGEFNLLEFVTKIGTRWQGSSAYIPILAFGAFDGPSYLYANAPDSSVKLHLSAATGDTFTIDNFPFNKAQDGTGVYVKLLVQKNTSDYAYTLAYSLDKQNWTSEQFISSTTIGNKIINLLRNRVGSSGGDAWMDLNETYIKVDGAPFFGPGATKNLVPGGTVVGSPTITNGIASGFSSSKYIKTTIPSTAQSIEIGFKFSRTAITESGTFALLDSSSYKFGFYTGQNNIVQCYIKNGSTNEYKQVSPDNNNQFLKVVLTPTTLTTYSSADGRTYTQHNSYSGDFSLSIGEIELGANHIHSNWKSYIGSIDLNNTYIKVDNDYVYRGMVPQAKTCSVVGCTGTADLTADDKAIATGKGWELTVA